MAIDAPVLTATDLTKSYGERVLLDRASLAIHARDRIGLVGINGAGKSTLAKILAGFETPDAGEVAARRGAEVLYLAQEPTFEGDPTAHDAALEGLSGWAHAKNEHEAITARMSAPDLAAGDIEALSTAQSEAAAHVERLGGWDLDHRVDAMLARLGVHDPETRVGTMSGGERRRVALARLLVAEPALAILDEPTNHLDVETIEWLEMHLRDEFAGALLLVTHDRYVLDRVCNKTVELDRGTLHVFDGGWGSYLAAKAERLEHEARVEQNRQNFLRREVDWLRRGPKARTTKQKARIDRAEAAIAARPERRQEAVAGLDVTSVRTGKTVLELHDVSIDLAGRRLVDDLTLILNKGERIGIVGPNGAGKTTLLRVLLEQLTPTEGRVVIGQNARLSYFDQTRSGLDDNLSIRENVAGDKRRITLGERTVDLIPWLEGTFRFSAHEQTKKVSALSGGERARVALAKLLLEPANVLLLDEPTNDLDVATLSALEDMLVELDGTALVVTHDRYFLDRVATSILAFEGDGRVVRYVGDYSTYRALRDRADSNKTRASREAPEATTPSASTAPAVSASSAPSGVSAEKKTLTYGERLELDGLLGKVDEAEKEVARLEEQLADPTLYVERHAEVPALQRQLAEARATLDAHMARWMALEEKKSG